MGASNACWGIEIGYGGIKAVKLVADGDSYSVADFAVINHPKALSTPDLDQDDALRVSLGALVSQHDLSSASIAISFPGHQSFARFAKLPPVEPKKVPEIVRFEAMQQIPFPLDEVEWDYQTFVSPDSPDVEVGIFAITKQRIAERLQMLGDIGVTPSAATISPVAAYNALATDLGFTEKSPGTIILDIGTVATDLIVAEAGRVWVRTFPIGGHQFTEALVSTFKLTYTKAEKLKKEAEQTKHARHVFQAMRPIFSDLAQEVQRSISFYQQAHPDADLKRLIGLGSTFRLPGLRKYLKQQLGLDVYRMEQFKKATVDGPRAGEFQASSLNLVTAYGCALQGLDSAPLKANLMPVQILRDAMWKRKVPWFAAAAGVAAAAGGAMFIRPLLDSAAYRGADQPRVINTVIADAGKLREEAEEAGVVGEADEIMAASRIVGLLEDRGLYAYIASDVGDLLASAQDVASARAEADASYAALGDEPVMELVTLSTRYSSGSDDDQDAGADPYAGFDQSYDDNPYGGNTPPFFSSRGNYPSDRDAPQRGRASDDAEPEEEGVVSKLTGKRHVRVDMVVDTRAPAPVRTFLLSAVEPWLREAAAREGAPYQVLFDAEPWQPTERPATQGATRSGAGGAQFQTQRADPRLRTPADPRFQSSVPVAGRQAKDLNQLAPLPIPETADDLSVTGTYRVTWYIVLDPIEDEEGGA